MAKKILNIVETAYRATIEEQDDPILWLAQAMQNNGGDCTVLLRANAVNYAVRDQQVPALAFGAWKATHPPVITDDLKRLKDKGVNVLLVAEDAAARGLEPSDLIPGMTSVSKADLPRIFAGFDQVWYW